MDLPRVVKLSGISLSFVNLMDRLKFLHFFAEHERLFKLLQLLWGAKDLKYYLTTSTGWASNGQQERGRWSPFQTRFQEGKTIE